MLDNRRIVHGDFNRPFQLFDGAIVIALLEIKPAEAIDIKAVVGLELERALDQVFGFVELNAHLGPGVA